MDSKLWNSEKSLSSTQVFIGISGLIGAGKTTLCTALSKALNLPAYYEPVIDNAYLADFYKDQKKYSFPLQVYLLNQRFRQQQQIIWQGKGGVQDRTIYEDSVFAKVLHKQGLMETRDYQTYCSLFANMSNFMRRPDVIIHLNVTAEESMERIKTRERSCESSIPLDYLCELYEAYEEFISEISRTIPVIKVDWQEFRDDDEMAEMVKREYSKMRLISHIDFNDKNMKGSDTIS